MTESTKAYANTEFKEKHKKYILTKVQCGCGTVTARCNMSHHKASKKHQQWAEENDTPREQIKRIYKMFEELDDIVKEFQDRLEKLEKKRV